MNKFKENDVVLNTKTGEAGTIHAIYPITGPSGPAYYVELSEEPLGRFVSWCEEELERIYEAKS